MAYPSLGRIGVGPPELHSLLRKINNNDGVAQSTDVAGRTEGGYVALRLMIRGSVAGTTGVSLLEGSGKIDDDDHHAGWPPISFFFPLISSATQLSVLEAL